jgi:predicted small secreted protein
MKHDDLLWSRTSQTILNCSCGKMGSVRWLILSMALLALLLTGCSTFTGGDTQSQPQAVNVNFFGTAANHGIWYRMKGGNALRKCPLDVVSLSLRSRH